MSKQREKLTRRQIDNLRSDSYKHAAQLLALLRESVTGKKELVACECGAEHELFPNKPKSLSTAQVTAAKFEINKVYPDISPEDIETATGQKDTGSLWDNLAAQLKAMQDVSIKELSDRGIFISFQTGQIIKTEPEQIEAH